MSESADPSGLPTAPIELHAQENAYICAWLFEYVRKHPGDVLACRLWAKVRAHAEALGVEWRYGDPDDYRPRDPQ